MTHTDYAALERQAEALLDGETDLVAAMANFTAFLNEHLPRVNWVGFYVLRGDLLVLGPFQGKVACTRIPVGQGVCGTAVALNATQRVANVHEFEGHIACDTASNAEIVIPIRRDGRIVAVLDIDSPDTDRFDARDEEGLEAIVRCFESALPVLDSTYATG